MGRRKKVVEEKVATKNEISYVGNVSISIQKNNRVIAKKTYHNSGTVNLFKFLCHCICGNYNSAESFRPFKIGLFYNNANTPAEAGEGNLIYQMPVFIQINKVSIASPILDANNNIINWKATLHFLIPYANITGDEKQVNQVCLYSKSLTFEKSEPNYFRDYSASYLLTKDNGGVEVWDPIELNTTGNNSYNLIIDWDMSFKTNNEE